MDGWRIPCQLYLLGAVKISKSTVTAALWWHFEKSRSIYIYIVCYFIIRPFINLKRVCRFQNLREEPVRLHGFFSNQMLNWLLPATCTYKSPAVNITCALLLNYKKQLALVMERFAPLRCWWKDGFGLMRTECLIVREEQGSCRWEGVWHRPIPLKPQNKHEN